VLGFVKLFDFWAKDMAKVSVGIPTYNRPEGLDRTLRQIINQTHSDLEIVVSNNASTDQRVGQILAEFQREDERITVFNQSENKGIFYNFLEVLRLSTADYFMWAADDDEWDSTFVEVCHEVLEKNNIGSVMPGYRIYNSALNVLYDPPFPVMRGVERFDEACAFFRDLPHSMFYGLHRKKTLEYLYAAYEDFTLLDDELVIVRQIIEHGYITLPDVWLYTGHINTPVYEIKSPMEAPGSHILYYKRIVHFIKFIAECTRLSDIQKLQILQKLVIQKLTTLELFEKNIRDPVQYEIAVLLRDVLKRIDFTKMRNYLDLMVALERF